MKKSILLSILAVSVLLASCEPIEHRDVLQGGITESQLNISAIPEIRDGVNSNYIQLNSDGNACLSSWNYGFGTLVATKGTVKVMAKGPNTIVYTGINADGTMITKSITVVRCRTRMGSLLRRFRSERLGLGQHRCRAVGQWWL